MELVTFPLIGHICLLANVMFVRVCCVRSSVVFILLYFFFEQINSICSFAGLILQWVQSTSMHSNICSFFVRRLSVHFFYSYFHSTMYTNDLMPLCSIEAKSFQLLCFGFEKKTKWTNTFSNFGVLESSRQRSPNNKWIFDQN